MNNLPTEMTSMDIDFMRDKSFFGIDYFLNGDELGEDFDAKIFIFSILLSSVSHTSAFQFKISPSTEFSIK